MINENDNLNYDRSILLAAETMLHRNITILYVMGIALNVLFGGEYLKATSITGFLGSASLHTLYLFNITELMGKKVECRLNENKIDTIVDEIRICGRQTKLVIFWLWVSYLIFALSLLF